MRPDDPAPDWYVEWAERHCELTGAGNDALKTLLAGAYIVVGDWQADFVELLECTRRLVSGCRVPKFANEHGDAVGLELRAMRAARKQAEAEEAEAARRPVACEDCGGGGAVPVPNTHCVRDGRAVAHPKLGYFATVVVWCRCEAGVFMGGRAQPYPAGPMTIDTYERGHVRREWWKRAMRDHREATGGTPRPRDPDSADALERVLAAIVANTRVPKKPRPRFLLPQHSN